VQEGVRIMLSASVLIFLLSALALLGSVRSKPLNMWDLVFVGIMCGLGTLVVLSVGWDW
jgi:hypothetical protein